MKIKRKSPRTGVVNEMDLDITEDDLDRWHNGELIQNVMSHLTVDEREFLISGYTAGDWKALFGDSEVMS